MYEKILFHPNLTLAEKAVLQAIVSFYNIERQMVYYHTEEQIAGALGINGKSVQRAIQKLTKVNLLSVTRRHHQCNLYEINFGYLIEQGTLCPEQGTLCPAQGDIMSPIHDDSLHDDSIHEVCASDENSLFHKTKHPSDNKKASFFHKESKSPSGTKNVDISPSNKVNNNGIKAEQMNDPELFDTKNDSFFQKFWTVYPRKVNKKQARLVFDTKISQGVAAKDIIAGAVRYAAQMAAEHQLQKYIKCPEFWLDDDRWEDEIVDPMIDQLKSSPHPLTDFVRESIRQDRLSFLNGKKTRLLQ